MTRKRAVHLSGKFANDSRGCSLTQIVEAICTRLNEIDCTIHNTQNEVLLTRNLAFRKDYESTFTTPKGFFVGQ